MMKRWITGILAAALLLFLAVPAFAVGNGYTDADGDGICDNRNQQECFVDKDGDGICDNRGSGFGLCRRNDNGTIFPCRNEDRRPRGQGNGCRENFVDENEDGICDNRSQGNGHHNGNGNGQGRQRGKNR